MLEGEGKGMELAGVDNRFPLAFYHRIVGQLAKQAKVYMEDGNSRDLSAVLRRYLRLTTEIIPQHNNYPRSSSKEKLHHKKFSEELAKELERLKALSTGSMKSTNAELLDITKKIESSTSFNESKIRYSDTIGTRSKSLRCNSHIDTNRTVIETLGSVYGSAIRNHDINVHVVKHSFPSEILSCVESDPLVGNVSQIVVPDSNNDFKSGYEESSSKSFQDIHISAKLMEEFMELARSNTEKELETCGVLGAFLKNQTFYATTLIIPKQESTCSSCQALNEEEIYAIQEELSLFPVGWIHTHPSQTCFMSSIDLHTQYSYQVMLPEALAIVMAPTDTTRKYGIFRLTDPGGISVIRGCQESGFHPHTEPADGSPIYENCSNVYINPNLRFEIIDLRCSS